MKVLDVERSRAVWNFILPIEKDYLFNTHE